MIGLKGVKSKMDQESNQFAHQSAAICKQAAEDRSSSFSQTPLPEGIQAFNVTHYRVGKYSYTNLQDATAEYQRQSSGELSIEEAADGRI